MFNVFQVPVCNLLSRFSVQPDDDTNMGKWSLRLWKLSTLTESWSNKCELKEIQGQCNHHLCE